MQTFPKKIASALGDKVLLNAVVKNVSQNSGRYTVSYIQQEKENTVEADIVISAIPSYNAAEVFRFDDQLVSHLEKIYYPPVIVLFLTYRKEDVGQPLDGFGFLIPEKEKKSFLGAIWSSVLFPGRTDDHLAGFTLFIGGGRNPDIVSMDKELIFSNAVREFQSIMKISRTPVSQSHRYWPKAIPQYNLGYIEHENYFDEFEKKYPGIIISGNFRGGISVGDCIKNSEIVYNKAKELLTV
jgi:protoporphyrinogen/coproporphyrinogen III oxidase